MAKEDAPEWLHGGWWVLMALVSIRLMWGTQTPDFPERTVSKNWHGIGKAIEVIV